ncbi:MAG TPA: bifunctional riboflavin kinase/FAD synthetase [Polyangiaceae bacterium]|jgi:riboflavin kinase/FMN adenylyltransferase|nr:bifunctional riboflavin kinase/FAD synthetase [Polyangiaceae bacterium]
MTAARLIAVDDTTTVASLDAVPCALVIGNFDGVHLGHQAVLREAVADARARGLSPCVLTFAPHPAGVVGRGAPPLLTTIERRAELVGELGVERMYVRRFDLAFAAWEPARFASELVVQTLGAKLVGVGANFRFGAKRAGELTLLRELGEKLGFDVHVHAVASDAVGRYSSTRAREAVRMGDLEQVRHVLGRAHALSGVVVHGNERGRTIGVPTANLEEVPELLPAHGVYAVTVDRSQSDGDGEGTREGGPHSFVPLAGGITNIGVRPTVGGGKLSIETFLFDFADDLYGARLRVHLVARIRDERKFGSLDELKEQIARDVAAARAALAAT